MAPSGLKKALSFPAVELAWQGQCEGDVEVVRLASQERVQQRPIRNTFPRGIENRAGLSK